MSKPAVPQQTTVHAFPRPEGTDLPARVFQHDEIITGEAVALRIQPANPILLIAGGALDFMVALITTIVTSLVLFILEPIADSPMSDGFYLIVSVVIGLVLFPSILETATQGRSAGRWLLGTRIVRDDGGTIRFRHAFIRALAGLLEIFISFGSIALIATISNPRHKRLGDLLAGTYPISSNAGELLPPPLIMPPELSTWAAQVDASRLPGTLTWRVRQFLNQTSELDLAHRYRIAHDLMNEASAHVSPPPPPGTHPERFLAALLVVRRDAEFIAAAQVERGLASRMRTTLPFDLEHDSPQQSP